MHPLLTSIVLFLVANAAAAQPVGTTPIVAPVHAAPSLIQTSAAAAGEPLPKPASGDLIKTAAAGPREVAMRQSPAVAGPAKPSASGEEDEPRRTGPAMLIAALAVMTAIALRRSGGSGR